MYYKAGWEIHAEWNEWSEGETLYTLGEHPLGFFFFLFTDVYVSLFIIKANIEKDFLNLTKKITISGSGHHSQG
jgi:hypothetical protein